jgi:hypothetical protein
VHQGVKSSSVCLGIKNRTTPQLASLKLAQALEQLSHSIRTTIDRLKQWHHVRMYGNEYEMMNQA